MGNFIWHDWARLVSIAACVYAIWACYWGFFYRKFFWDFVGGTLRDPGGLQAPKNQAFFIDIIVKFPVIQIIVFLHAFFLLALEWPLPVLKKLPIHRSLALRVVLLILQSFLSILFYQGTNATIYGTIAAFGYTRAIMMGETMEVAKENRGSREKA
ncbi:hypothetical protein SCHPADRAFT_939410 [Schizopora paradoxa]|uniref:DUF7727 domain-containing protein n=1 Tax=Schizopora paradoxa TaxID=27342 RepID=A0A0H2RRZ2_9AGAM|nr:hypothetical protein SCHPADRAFT_939410 [Schizopora paradoxa]